MRKRKKKSNKSTFLLIILVLLLLLLIAFIYIKNPAITDKFPVVTAKQPEPAVTTPSVTPIASEIPSSTVANDTIKLAAFNLQVFGTTKAGKPEVMGVLSKIIRNYDVIAVQEIRDESQTALPMLRAAVDSMGNPQYDYVVSERLGRTTSKEQYAYIYNSQTIQPVGSPYVFPDSNDLFQREPYVSKFKAKNGNFDFVLVTIHTDPDTANQEISDLPKVVEDAKSRYQAEGDFIVMGDLNADCSYFNENSQSPLRSSDYIWVINESMDTTTKSTDCTYDRIIITTPAKTDFTGEAGVFRFDTAYNLTYESTIAVSDHYPIYASFWNNRDND
ncbi:MAG TPA: endonuclease/exonuclease/phosphatase family protein [Candidatus Methylomirabilis sp.]|nr:endonuclease/exonuclease/phosphatase family protein [Candidatus Methylomirabilis sp.]